MHYQGQEAHAPSSRGRTSCLSSGVNARSPAIARIVYAPPRSVREQAPASTEHSHAYACLIDRPQRAADRRVPDTHDRSWRSGRCLSLERRGCLGPHSGTKAPAPARHHWGYAWGVEVGTVITILTVEAALEQTCATFRDRADRGDITPAECDLLIDGAILLAMHIDDLASEGRAGSAAGWLELARPAPSGRHERYPAAAAA